MRNHRFILLFAACFGVAVTLLAWLLNSPDSPLQTSSSVVKTAVGLIHLIPFILASIISGNVHGGSDAAYFIFVWAQWFIVGFVLALLFRILRGRSEAA